MHRYKGLKKETVEDCLVLSVTELIKKRAIILGSRTEGLWRWTYEHSTRVAAQIEYEADLRVPTRAWMQLRYIIDGEHVATYVWLTCSQPHFGGLRWFFCCPSLGIRVGKLYLPPGGRIFASRKAHDLTYASCQRSRSGNRSSCSSRTCLVPRPRQSRSRRPPLRSGSPLNRGSCPGCQLNRRFWIDC